MYLSELIMVGKNLNPMQHKVMVYNIHYTVMYHESKIIKPSGFFEIYHFSKQNFLCCDAFLLYSAFKYKFPYTFDRIFLLTISMFNDIVFLYVDCLSVPRDRANHQFYKQTLCRERKTPGALWVMCKKIIIIVPQCVPRDGRSFTELKIMEFEQQRSKIS